MAGNTISTDVIARQKNEIFFWIFAVVILLVFLGRNELWNSEGEWAETVREMVFSGDYLHPSLNWQIKLDQHHLLYWLIVPLARAFNRVNEFIVRLSSVLAAIAGLYGTMTLGKLLFDRQTALLGSWLLLGSFGFLFCGRTVGPDMVNLAAVIIAIAYFFQVEKQARFFYYFGFYLISFVAAAMNGLPTIIQPLMVIIPYLLLERRWKKHINFSNFASFLLVAALYFTPFYLARIIPLAADQQQVLGIFNYSSLQQVWHENVLNEFSFDLDYRLLNLSSLPGILLPWTALVVIGIYSLIRQRRGLPPTIACLLYGVLLLLLWFLVTGKRHWGCTLPIIPLGSLLGAAGVTRYRDSKWNNYIFILMRYLVIITGSLCLASLIALPLWFRVVRIQPPGLLIAALTIAGTLSLVVMLLDNQSNMPIVRLTGMPSQMAATVLSGTILMGSLFCGVLPALTQFYTAKTFFLKLKGGLAGIPPEAILFWQGNVDSKFLFYLDLYASARNTLSRNPEVNYAALRRFLADNAGGRVAFIANNNPAELAELGEASKRLGIKINLQKSDYFEEAAPGIRGCLNKKLVWVQDLTTYVPIQQ